jgi:hypothetical protein
MKESNIDELEKITEHLLNLRSIKAESRSILSAISIGEMNPEMMSIGINLKRLSSDGDDECSFSIAGYYDSQELDSVKKILEILSNLYESKIRKLEDELKNTKINF